MRRPLVLGCAAGLAASALAIAPTPAQADPDGTGLVISEFYGNGGNANADLNADYVELYNPTDNPIPLTDLTIQYRSATGSAGANGVVALSGEVPANDYFLVQVQTAGQNGSPIPTPDLTTSNLNAGGTNGLVFLADSTTALTLPTGSVVDHPQVIDLLGFGTANTFETVAAGATPDNTVSYHRTDPAVDTNNNGADFVTGDQTPTPSSAEPAGLDAADPGDVTAFVGVEIDPIELSATGGEPPYTWDIDPLPAGLAESEDGVITGTPTAVETVEVTATVTDSAEPDPGTDEVTFTITVAEAPPTVTIAEIQGTGNTSPLAGDTVTTEGVVTAAYPVGGLNGFYIQTPGPDETPGASDGLFVYGPSFDESTLEIGDPVAVTGEVSEFSGLTEITADDVVVLAEDLGEVVPNTLVPGTECELPGEACLTGAALDAAREEVEGEVFLPADPYTVTDVYDGSAYTGSGSSSAMYGEIGLAANSDMPLVTPTEVEDAQEGDVEGRTDYNTAHRLILDDGSTTNYANAQGSPFPYLTADHSVRVGAAVAFEEPVVLEYRNNTWKLQPQHQVVGEPEGIAFEQTREDNALPQDVGGDVKLATFNVLNYFPTTGEEWEAADPANNSCTYYNDRQGNPITTRSCGTDANPGPRGAADAANLERQEDKIVDAIVKLGADVVTLEEIENSVHFGKDRDFAVATLVDALNEAEGAEVWDYVPSPSDEDLPPVAEQDVIRLAAIYKPATVELVGGARVLTGSEAFEDAREPFAQAFKAAGDVDEDAFAVIANHFKSKGSGEDDGTGQGNANPARVAQAEALVDFADEFAAERGIERVFLTGDFNAYSAEDPVQVLEDAGYTNLESDEDPDEESYNFDGMIGSLDHVFANDAAFADVVGVDVWQINAEESVYYEYSRYNYNATDLYAVNPFRSSDHNPEIVGIEADVATEPAPVKTSTTATPKKKKVKKGKAFRVKVVVTAEGQKPQGKVQILRKGKKVAVGQLKNGKVTIKVPGKVTKKLKGKQTFVAKYLGKGLAKPSRDTFTIRVVRKR